MVVLLVFGAEVDLDGPVWSAVLARLTGDRGWSHPVMPHTLLVRTALSMGEVQALVAQRPVGGQGRALVVEVQGGMSSILGVNVRLPGPSRDTDDPLAHVEGTLRQIMDQYGVAPLDPQSLFDDGDR